jgi:hypothetical protein
VNPAQRDAWSDWIAPRTESRRPVATAYPNVGRISLIEPNEVKLERARTRLASRLGDRVTALGTRIGNGHTPSGGKRNHRHHRERSHAGLGWAGRVAERGSAWIHRALSETRAMLRLGGWLYDVETIAMPWDVSSEDGPLRWLTQVARDLDLTESGVAATTRYPEGVLLGLTPARPDHVRRCVAFPCRGFDLYRIRACTPRHTPRHRALRCPLRYE